MAPSLPIDFQNLRLVMDVGTFLLLAGVLWKISRMAQRVEMMWQVFAADHGLDGNGKGTRRRRVSG